eukprot:TRINITY_DN25905_c0_g1_i1.p1 TRINITY_DN25905_c0_g1~~TRINITY_DN25905_c0_g1_i1.p1  ORF type:complete len:749 (-),score=127.86 TRINITY_DN25905_c0_g1_i1:88-2334(-)
MAPFANQGAGAPYELEGTRWASPGTVQHRRRRESLTRAWLAVWEGRLEKRSATPPGSRLLAPNQAQNGVSAMLEIFCAFCRRTLSCRGLRVQLVADASITLYSTDLRPSGVVDIGNARSVPGSCGCSVSDFACGCGATIGYCIGHWCGDCGSRQDDGHRWFMSSQCVHVAIRRAIDGSLISWPETAKAEEINRDGCIADPCGHHRQAQTPSKGMSGKEDVDPTFGSLPFAAPLCDTNGRSGSGRPTPKTGVCPREADLQRWEHFLAARADELTAREANIFEKELALESREKLQQGVASAQQEAEEELHRREQAIVPRERAVAERERAADDRDQAFNHRHQELVDEAVTQARAQAQRAMDDLQTCREALSAQQRLVELQVERACRAEDDALAKASEKEALRSSLESLTEAASAKEADANEVKVRALADVQRAHEALVNAQTNQRKVEADAARERDMLLRERARECCRADAAEARIEVLQKALATSEEGAEMARREARIKRADVLATAEISRSSSADTVSEARMLFDSHVAGERQDLQRRQERSNASEKNLHEADSCSAEVQRVGKSAPRSGDSGTRISQSWDVCLDQASRTADVHSSDHFPGTGGASEGRIGSVASISAGFSVGGGSSGSSASWMNSPRAPSSQAPVSNATACGRTGETRPNGEALPAWELQPPSATHGGRAPAPSQSRLHDPSQPTGAMADFAAGPSTWRCADVQKALPPQPQGGILGWARGIAGYGNRQVESAGVER